jgi:hypothetical protein
VYYIENRKCQSKLSSIYDRLFTFPIIPNMLLKDNFISLIIIGILIQFSIRLHQFLFLLLIQHAKESCLSMFVYCFRAVAESLSFVTLFTLDIYRIQMIELLDISIYSSFKCEHECISVKKVIYDIYTGLALTVTWITGRLVMEKGVKPENQINITGLTECRAAWFKAHCKLGCVSPLGRASNHIMPFTYQ